MATEDFVKMLAGYFGFPFVLTVAFALLLFWICKYFKTNAITRGPDPNHQLYQPPVQPPAIPARNLNLRQMAAAAIFLLLIPSVNLKKMNHTLDLKMEDYSGKAKALNFSFEVNCLAKLYTLKWAQSVATFCQEGNYEYFLEIPKGMCGPICDLNDDPRGPQNAQSSFQLSETLKIVFGVSTIVLAAILAVFWLKKKQGPSLLTTQPDR